MSVRLFPDMTQPQTVYSVITPCTALANLRPLGDDEDNMGDSALIASTTVNGTSSQMHEAFAFSALVIAMRSPVLFLVVCCCFCGTFAENGDKCTAVNREANCGMTDYCCSTSNKLVDCAISGHIYTNLTRSSPLRVHVRSTSFVPAACARWMGALLIVLLSFGIAHLHA